MEPLVFPALCGVFIAMAVPLILQKVPPNCVYGFRTRKTLSSTASLRFFSAALLFPEAIPAYFVRQVAGLVLVLPLGMLVAVSAVYLRTL